MTPGCFQFEICTAEIAHSLLELAERVKESNPKLYERLLGEVAGLNWLLRTVLVMRKSSSLTILFG